MPGERLESPLPAATRTDEGLLRLYRPPLVAALPSGAIAGALTAVGFQLDGLDPGTDLASAVATALLCAAVGVLVAAVAVLGAAVAVLLFQHRLRAQRSVGYGTVAMGAGVAVGGATLLVAVATGAGEQAWVLTAVVVALAAGVLSAAAAAVVTALALRWWRPAR